MIMLNCLDEIFACLLLSCWKVKYRRKRLLWEMTLSSVIQHLTRFLVRYDSVRIQIPTIPFYCIKSHTSRYVVPSSVPLCLVSILEVQTRWNYKLYIKGLSDLEFFFLVIFDQYHKSVLCLYYFLIVKKQRYLCNLLRKYEREWLSNENRSMWDSMQNYMFLLEYFLFVNALWYWFTPINSSQHCIMTASSLHLK